MHNGMLDKAEEFYFTSLELKPNYYISNLNLGLLYLRQGRYEDAVDFFERGLDAVPSSVNVRNNLGVALLRLGRYEEARAHLELIIDLSPDMAPPYFNVAITYVLEKDYDNALSWIERGSARCSPVKCQEYLADSDFNPIRETTRYKELLTRIYPKVHRLPDIPEG